MSKFPKVLIVIAVVAVVVVIGIAVGWLGSSHRPENPPPPVVTTTQTPQTPGDSTPSPTPVKHPGKTTNEAKQGPNIAEVTNGTTPPVAVATATNQIPDWEDKLDAILTSDGDDAVKAKQMLDMFPHLSAEAQEEVAHHLSNLTADENYGPLGSYLTNSSLPEAVLDVLLEDVLNRPNSVKLPTLLEIARDPQHPKAAESKDILELFLEEDYGTDWTKWQAKMDQWLKDNPD